MLRAAAAEVAGEMDAAFDLLLALPDDPRRVLFEAMRHAAMDGGKRLRPLLVILYVPVSDTNNSAGPSKSTVLNTKPSR